MATLFNQFPHVCRIASAHSLLRRCISRLGAPVVKNEFAAQDRRRNFHSASFLSCDNALNQDQKELRDHVRSFALNEIAPIAAQIDKNDEFPEHLWPMIGKLGILGPTVPLEYGGLGLGYLEHIIIMEEISRHSGSIALSYGAHSNLCVNQIARWGTSQQKELYLPKLLDGSWLGALAMSEVSAGSDVIGMKTVAEKKGDQFILNGSKMWITNGPRANVFVVYAKTDPSAASKGISAFLVEKGTPGLTTGQKLDKLGMRGSETCELVFEDCAISEEQLLGKLHQGATILMSGLDSERLVLAAGPVGLMQACYDLVVPYVNTRTQFSKHIGDFQIVQGTLADMYSALGIHRAYLYSLATAFTAGEAGRKDCAAAILNCAEKATWMASGTIQLLGGNGYINDYPSGRILRDAKLYEIGAGTSEIRRMLIGREINNAYRHAQ